MLILELELRKLIDCSKHVMDEWLLIAIFLLGKLV